MKIVTITYRRWWRNITLRIEVPERWEDLKSYQFEVCAQLHIAPPTDEEFINRFFKIPQSIVKKLTKFEIYKLTDLVGFAVTPAATTSHFFMAEIPGTGLISPRRMLENITLEHFALTDTYFFKYANEPTPERLAAFVASLYLKKKEVLTAIDFTKRVEYVQNKVDKCTLYAIFLNYLFIRKWLSKSFPYLFESDDDTEETPQSRRRFKVPVKPLKKTLPPWIEIIEGFVGEDILHYDDYIQMPCVRAFKTINKRIKIYKKNAR